MELAASGKILLFLAALTSTIAAILSAIGYVRSARSWLPVAGRYCLYGAFGFAAGSAACLAAALGFGIYDIEYVYDYSERHLPLAFRVSALWAGISGSLLFWSLLLSGAVALAAHRLARAPEEEGLRKLEPCVCAVLAAVAAVFFMVTWVAEPFRVLPIEARLRLAAHSGVEIDEAGSLLDGVGLNQQLVNYWFVVHPPTLYLGFVLWAVPYALTIAALFTRRFGPFWLRRLRVWSVSAWIFLTAGIILGGLWAYRQLGWGGYWAWDPVENASLLPWLTGTAALHSILAEERRGRLRLWTASLVIATFYLTVVATWITRSGVVRSVHAFAGGAVGTWLLVFLFALGAFSLFAFAYGLRSLANDRAGGNALSREAFFGFANLLFVLIAAIVFVLTFLPKISHDWFAKTVTDPGGAIYYRVVTPFFALLIATAGLGPALNWKRTEVQTLARRLAVPGGLAGLFLAGLFLVLRAARASSSGGGQATSGESGGVVLYPSGVFLGLACFVATVAGQNIVEWILRRKREAGGSLAAALRALALHPRCLSAPTAHLGIALLAVGIVVSSMFQVHETHFLALGESGRVGNYSIAPIRRDEFPEPRPGEPYAKVEVRFQVRRAPDPLASGSSALGASSGQPELVADLLAERRYYPKRNQWISEVTIRRGLWEDIYLYFSGWDSEGRIGFTVYLNPFMIFVYLGSAVLVAGGIFALFPWRGFAGLSQSGLRSVSRLWGRIFRARAGFACFVLAAFSSGASPLEAGLTFRARVYDGEASSSALRSAFEKREALSEALKVPLRETAVTVELVPLTDGGAGSPGEPEPGKGATGRPQEASRSWSATTSPEGELSLETGLEAFPAGHAFVVRASRNGTRLYSPFFTPRETTSEAQPVHLYPITESPDALRAELRIGYELEKGEDPKLVVRIALELLNFGNALYVGRRSETGWREIWRLPLPKGAEILLNRGPERAHSAWRLSEDLRWLVLDAPIPGFCDLDAQGTYEVHYRLNARQHQVQTLPLAIGIEAQRVSAWAPREDILLASAQLRERFEGAMQDPFLGKERDLQVLYSGEGFPAGARISVAASVDNAAIGQISVRAALLVGGFVALLAVAFVLGFWLSPDRVASERRGQSPEEFAARVLALIQDFDPASDPGCALLAERVLETAGAFAGKELQLSLARIPPETLEILSRLETAEGADSPDSDPKERMRLLEALADSLKRSARSRPNGRES